MLPELVSCRGNKRDANSKAWEVVWCQLSTVLCALLGPSVLCFEEGQAEQGRAARTLRGGMCELSPIRSSSCVSIQTFASFFLQHFAKSCGFFTRAVCRHEPVPPKHEPLCCCSSVSFCAQPHARSVAPLHTCCALSPRHSLLRTGCDFGASIPQTWVFFSDLKTRAGHCSVLGWVGDRECFAKVKCSQQCVMEQTPACTHPGYTAGSQSPFNNQPMCPQTQCSAGVGWRQLGVCAWRR